MTAKGEHSRRAARRSQVGAVGGAEGLLFGMLVLVAGSIVVVNLWAVIDTRAALDAAAREYLRTYTEQSDVVTARGRADQALAQVLRARGTEPARVRVATSLPNGFGPCALVQVEVSTSVSGVQAPFLDRLGSVDVHVVHRELIDAHEEVTPDAAYDPLATDCASG